MKALSLVTDAFGGRGGIAQYNRNFLAALATHPDLDVVVALPRVATDRISGVPEKVRYDVGATRGKLAYAIRFLSALATERFDLIICSHIHLLPLAILAARLNRAPVVLLIYGVEAWEAPKRLLTRSLINRLSAVLAISRFTATKFTRWSGLPEDRVRLLPCCIDTRAFGPGAKDAGLLRRYGLVGRTILLTVARLAGAERYKGFDEVIEALPELARDYPLVSYLIAGEGPDKRRLGRKAEALGVGDRVVFAGYISEEDKAAHYRLADAFVMPGRGEGFGIVYLEAMACGVPVMGSQEDASAEVLRGGELGTLVDPADPKDVLRGLRSVLAAKRPDVAAHLQRHSVPVYHDRCREIISDIASTNSSRSPRRTAPPSPPVRTTTR